MPRVREYAPEVSSAAEVPGRRATAQDFGDGSGLLAAGRALSGVGDIVQDAAERQEVSDVHARLAKARADWTVALNERAISSPAGDATFATKFNDDFAAYLGKMEEGLHTRAAQLAFQRGASELSSHFVQAAGLHQAASMGAKAKQDYLGALDAWRNALVSDPTQFGSVLRESSSALNDPYGAYARISPEERAKLERQTRAELALSTGRGLIVNGAPELARKQLLDGKFDQYLDADKKAELINGADVAIRAKDAAAERARLEQERAVREAQKAVMDGYLQRIVDPRSQGGPLNDKEILANQTIDWNQKEHLIEYRLRRARELSALAETKTHPAEVRRLMLEIHAGEDDPRKTYNADSVMDSYTRAQISTSEMVFLRREVEQLRDGNTSSFQKDVQSARNAVYTAITRSTLGQVQPEVAADAAYRWSRDLEAAIAKKRRANEDPRVLLTPGNKEYMLDPRTIMSYLQSPKAAVATEASNRVSGKITGAIPGLIEAGNINLNTRKVVNNADGTISTERSMSFGEDGKEVLIPTVVNGKILSKDDAIAHYRRTGEHLGKFTTPAAADAYAEQLHLAQEQRYAPKGLPTATNRQTGEKLVFKDGKWQKP